MTTSDILGYEVQAATAEECISDIVLVLSQSERKCAWMACLNPHSYTLARKDTVFRKSLNASDWLVPDGVGILLAARVLNRPVAKRITGFDIFDGVMAELNRISGSVFFLGSSEETLELIARKLPVDYPNVRLAGVYSPPFKAELSQQDSEAMIDVISRSKADVLWVGMTAPKQEKWIFAHRDRLPVKFAGAIGAVFDFYSGQVKRSHPVYQRLGLEWLPRLLRQPRRLWKRMFVSAPLFLFDVLKSRLGLPLRSTINTSNHDKTK